MRLNYVKFVTWTTIFTLNPNSDSAFPLAINTDFYNHNIFLYYIIILYWTFYYT